MLIIDQSIQEEISELFLQTFPRKAIKGKIEIYYGDGYAEFPKVYMSASNTPITPEFKGWESPEMIADSKLMGVLSEEILPLRDGFTKIDKEYWNHFLFVCNEQKESKYNFSYIPDLDEQAEAETRVAIGDELYEKFEQKIKDFKPTEVEVVNPPINKSMTTSQLLGYIHHELGEELVDIDWQSLILDTEIEVDEIEKSISTHFYYFSPDSEKQIEFEPENPIGLMNAVMLIRDRMTEEGSGWNKSTITLHKNGEVEFKL